MEFAYGSPFLPHDIDTYRLTSDLLADSLEALSDACLRISYLSAPTAMPRVHADCLRDIAINANNVLASVKNMTHHQTEHPAAKPR